MPLDFLKGETQGASQEAVAYVDDGETADTEYEGRVEANIPELVVVDGPEQVLAYVNGVVEEVDEVPSAEVEEGNIILDPNVDDLATFDGAVEYEGGLFFNADEAVDAEDVDGEEVEGDLPDDGTMVFLYEDDDDETDTQFVVEEDGIPVVLQASGY